MTFAYLNGELVDKSELKVSVNDFGFARGNVVFELTRVYGDKPFRLDAHIDRLMNSLDVCHISQPYSKGDFKRMIFDLMEKNGMPHSVAKVYVTQGMPRSPAWSLEVAENFEPQVMVIQDEFKPFSEEYPAHERYYKEGMSLATAEVERTLPQAKTTNYVNAIVESSKVAANGFEDILYINRDGIITECSRSNIFFVKDGELLTPAIDMLAGVTRQAVIDLAKSANITVKELDMTKDDLPAFDEVFMTGSTVELMPVKQVDGVSYDLENYQVYKKLWQLFKAEISSL